MRCFQTVCRIAIRLPSIFCFFILSAITCVKVRTTNKYLLLAIFFILLSASVRSNMLVVFLAPAFITGGGIKRVLPGPAWIKVAACGGFWVWLLCFCGIIFMWCLIKPVDLFPYTYSNRRFYFSKTNFDGLFSYHIGILYILLFALSLWGLKFVNRRLRILPAGFLVFRFLYSSRWYWPIMQRPMIDYYVIPAMRSALISGVSGLDSGFGIDVFQLSTIGSKKCK